MLTTTDFPPEAHRRRPRLVAAALVTRETHRRLPTASARPRWSLARGTQVPATASEQHAGHSLLPEGARVIHG